MSPAHLISGFMLLLMALSPASADSSSDYSSTGNREDAAAYQAVRFEKFEEAEREFSKLVERHPENPDYLNMLGFSKRKLKQYEDAETFYKKALAIKPKHKGANEYLGQLYVETDRIELARERLAVLDKACFFRCSQYKKLQKSIQAWEQAQATP